MTIEELKKAFIEAREANTLAERAMNDEIAVARAKFDAEKKQIEEKHNETLLRTHKRYFEADKALKGELEKEVLEAQVANLPYPEGTVMVEFEKYVPFGASGINKNPLRLSGTKGVFQVYRNGDEYPANLGRYKKPQNGDYIIRLYRVDGTLGKAFERWTNELKFCKGRRTKWVKEGETP